MYLTLSYTLLRTPRATLFPYTTLFRSKTMYKIIGADGKEYGPISAEQLRQWIVEGRANAQTRVLLEGTADWKTLAEIPEFAANLSAPAPGFAPGPVPAAFPGPVASNAA